MENEKIILIRKFNHGQLTPQEFDRLEELFVSGQIDIEALESFGYFEKKTEYLPFNMEEIDANFNRLLQHQVDRATPRWAGHAFGWFTPILRYALPVFTLLVGLVIGQYCGGLGPLPEPVPRNQPHTVEIQLIDRFLNDPLVTNRVEALALLQKNNGNRHNIDFLFFSLNHDPSTLVRLEALDAILDHAHSFPIEDRLLNALKRQESPYLAQYLSEALRQMGKTLPPEQFRQLLHHNIPSEAVAVMESNLRTF